MTISSSTKLGRYEIRSKLGEGGMGEVYLPVRPPDAIDYDVSADGQRFLVRTTAGAPPLPLSVFTGWSANLKH